VEKKTTVQMFSWTLGVYDSNLLAIHGDRGKRVKAINALVYSFNFNGCEWM
jgi:hypothetical protein